MDENRKNNNESKFISIIEDVTKYVKEEKLDEKLTEVLSEEASLQNNKATEIVEEISSTIDLISDNYQSLKEAKEKGKSRTKWFEEQLDATIEKHKIKDT